MNGVNSVFINLCKPNLHFTLLKLCLPFLKVVNKFGIYGVALVCCNTFPMNSVSVHISEATQIHDAPFAVGSSKWIDVCHLVLFTMADLHQNNDRTLASAIYFAGLLEQRENYLGMYSNMLEISAKNKYSIKFYYSEVSVFVKKYS